MNTLNHDGYTASIAFDDEDGIFVGRILGINDVVGFHADNVEDLRAAFREALDDYLETCRKIGKTPERARSGKLLFRVAPEIHAKAIIAAEAAGMSLNQWGEAVLAKAAGVESK